jgi:hypothetical protein
MRFTPSLMTWTLSLVCSAFAFADGEPVKLVRVPDGGLQPQTVMDRNGVLHLVYLKGDPKACDVIYARREPGQTNFSRSLRVNGQPGSAMAIGTVRGAQVALGRNGRLHMAWNGSDQAQPRVAHGSPMLYARSNEAGDTFEPERNVMISTHNLDGGGSVAADDLGNVYVIWHGHPSDGPQDELNRGVFMAKSTNDGKTFAAEKQVNPDLTGACGCCGLKAFVNSQGNLAVLYRSAAKTGGRDVTLLISRNRGESFQSKIVGPWRIAMCPMSTMALGQGQGDELLAMWEAKGKVYAQSFKGVDSREQGRVVENAGENQKHPVFAMNSSGEMLMTWTEGTGWAKGGAVAWAIIDAKGVLKAKGRAEGVPVWGGVAAVAERDGGFTIFF